MKPFLYTVAENVLAQYGEQLNTLNVVFPNNRSGLFFRQHLARLLQKPSWSPKTWGINELAEQLSQMSLVASLPLIFELHKIYNRQAAQPESLDSFYFWGQMLLRDFDEVDKQGVDAEALFQVLAEERELEARFADILDEEQIRFLEQFWSNFDASRSSKAKEFFLNTWKALPHIYTQLRQRLLEDQVGYAGLVYAQAVEALKSGKGSLPAGQWVFVGFNALNKQEEELLSWFVEHQNATVYWDGDPFYVEDTWQEAGHFLRQYKTHPVLKTTVPHQFPSHRLGSAEQEIRLIPVAQTIAQAEVAGRILASLPEGTDWAQTALVLPETSLMLPVLNHLPSRVDALNVTIGFPFRESALYSLMAQVVDLQTYRKATSKGQALFHHRAALGILRHPYVLYVATKEINSLVHTCEAESRVYISQRHFSGIHPLLDAIFQPAGEGLGVVDYFRQVVFALHASIHPEGVESKSAVEDEFLYTVITSLEFLYRQFEPEELIAPESLETFWRLFRQVLQSETLPFTGEPLKGLQILGVLEARNLDFENLILLSLNEGSLPKRSGEGSFIPYHLRKAFGLDTHREQDATFAYHLYRLMQRAKRVWLLYSTETEGLNAGEMSRFLHQMRYHPGLSVIESQVSESAQAQGVPPIQYEKDALAQAFLAEYTQGDKTLSPSRLNTWLDCRLKFYFRYILGLKEPAELKEELDSAQFGTILHGLMEDLYRELHQQKGHPQVEKADFPALKSRIPALLDKHLKEAIYSPEEQELKLEGRNLIVRHVLKHYAERLVQLDEGYAPFTILGLESEEEGGLPITLADGRRVVLEGIIDRVDEKNGVIRVLDYKTGADETLFRGAMDELFSPRHKTRPKALIQLFLYATLMGRKAPDKIIQPGLILTRAIYQSDYQYDTNPLIELGKERITDFRQLEPDYQKALTESLEALFSPDEPFTQTEVAERCTYCAYRRICER